MLKNFNYNKIVDLQYFQRKHLFTKKLKTKKPK